MRQLTTMTFVPALVCGLLLAACASADAPDLSKLRSFRAFPVYYAGDSVADLPLEEVLGDPTAVEDKRELAWIFIYGHCEDPPGEGGCPYPLQIHDYSTCERWAGSLEHHGHLIDFRGAKAYRSKEERLIHLEIFTGATTVKLGGDDPQVIEAAARALRTVRQGRPKRLPPPLPGSLKGELPCQGKGH
jgi:hypothetical protein